MDIEVCRRKRCGQYGKTRTPRVEGAEGQLRTASKFLGHSWH